MSLVHVHLLTNHIPVIGVPFVAAILVAALWMKSSDVAKLGLLLLAGVALLSIIPYATGDSAAHAVRDIAGVTRASVREHDDAAGWAFTGCCIIGALGLGLLWLYRGRELPRKVVGMSLAAVLLVSTMLARTAYLGGLIRHTEVREAPTDSTTAK
jgi:hypothetical protein